MNILNVLVLIAICVLIASLLFLASFYYRRGCNNKVPEGGINESAYVEINGSRQWMNIYGKNVNNPVMLYLHGGPGIPTSLFDYAIFRKWSDVYTIVTWDQRGCGKSLQGKGNSVELSDSVIMGDAMAVADYVRTRMQKDKITILGHSWGSLLGARMILENPDRFEAFIGTGQLIDLYDCERSFFDELKKRAKDDSDDMEAIQKILDAKVIDDDYYALRNKLMHRYGLDIDLKKSDIKISRAALFNPYYSSKEQRDVANSIKDLSLSSNPYIRFISDEKNGRPFSLNDVKEFPVPYYNINGDQDYVADFRMAQAFFDELKAPAKRMYLLKGVSHGTFMEDSEGFSRCIHEIAKSNK